MHETLFSLSNLLVLPAWLCLIFAPQSKSAQKFIHSGLISFLLGLLYCMFFVQGIWSGHPGGFGSLSGVRSLMSSQDWLLAGWVHYLAFDLFLGAWQVRDAQQIKLPHLWVIPCLVLTFLAGPVGLSLYLGIRWGFGKQKPITI